MRYQEEPQSSFDVATVYKSASSIPGIGEMRQLHHCESPPSPTTQWSFEEAEAMENGLHTSHKNRPVRIWANHWFADDASLEVEETFMITSSISDVNERYYIDETVVGTGHFGIVRRCMDIKTRQWYAIKTIEKAKILDDEVVHLKREIMNLTGLDHPNIIRLVDTCEDEFYLHLITELCYGGELYDSIIDTVNRKGRFDEQDAANIIHQALKAIDYCHNTADVVHRDIKPENFMFVESPPATNKSKFGNDYQVKLIDFGLSTRHCQGDEPLDSCVGTPYYIAPEVLAKSYDRKCDLWSIGVIAYVLLCGYPPFEGNSNLEIFNEIYSNEVQFNFEDWKGVSYEAMDFIHSLLEKDPTERMGAKEALNHIWLQKQLRRGDDEERQ